MYRIASAETILFWIYSVGITCVHFTLVDRIKQGVSVCLLSYSIQTLAYFNVLGSIVCTDIYKSLFRNTSLPRDIVSDHC